MTTRTELQQALQANETHQDAYLDFKNQISTAIGAGRLPNDAGTLEWLRGIDGRIAALEAERQAIRFNLGYPFSSMPPAAGGAAPDPDLRRSVLAGLYGDGYADSDRQLWGDAGRA